MTRTPLISVIVPVYNAGKYLPQCLKSLSAQTYPNFEVILVDDGSTDNSSTICDQHAQQDTRFTVIHQPNAGAVAARKRGIQQAKGTLLSFVDSDDWVEDDFLTHLYQIRTYFKADISVCAPFGQFSRYQNCGQLVCGQEKALQIIFTDNFFAGYLWNKLYPMSYWKDITWPPQSMFEDLFLNAQLFNKVSHVAFSQEKKYHYRRVQGSISHKRFQKDKLFYFEITAMSKDIARTKQMNQLCQYLCVRNLVAACRDFFYYLLARPKDKVMGRAILVIMQNAIKEFVLPVNQELNKIALLIQECFWLVICDIYQLILHLKKTIGNKKRKT